MATDVWGTITALGPASTYVYGGGGYDPIEVIEEVPCTVIIVYPKYGVISTPFIPLLILPEKSH